MGLMSPGLGDIGTFVTGTGKTAASVANGQEGVLATLELPSAGIWMITATGWWPTDVSAGYVYLEHNGGTIGGIGHQSYQFSVAGIESISGKSAVNLKIVNWSEKTVSNLTVPGLKFRAVKVGNV